MYFWPTWIALVTAHALLALIPFAIHQSKVTALIPYLSYFGVLSVLNDVGLKVFADFSEGVFMAPVSALGNVLVALFWLFVHSGIAAVLTSASKNFAFCLEKVPIRTMPNHFSERMSPGLARLATAHVKRYVSPE